MAKPKHIKPAPPVATDPGLRELELLRRREIARHKEVDMDEGRKESLSVSVMVSKLDAKVLRGTKAFDTDRKRTDAAHGSRDVREARWLCITQTYAALALAHPEWRPGRLDFETAKACDVGLRTVQRHKNTPPASKSSASR